MSFAPTAVPHQNLQERAISRLLLQFRRSLVLAEILGALVKEVQALNDAAEAVQSGRTPAAALGEQLNGLGRIVGQTREGYTYDENIWFAPDIATQNVDIAYAWVPGGYLLGTFLADDETYRRLIEAKVFRNFCKYGSVTEIQTMFMAAFGFPISFRRVGEMEVDVIVPNNIPNYALGAIVNFKDTGYVDQRGLLPWPATLRINEIIEASEYFTLFAAQHSAFADGHWNFAGEE